MNEEETGGDRGREGGDGEPEGEGGAVVKAVSTAMVAAGALAMLSAAALWIMEYFGVPTGRWYLLLGIGGLIVYNLGRLPYYLRMIFPGRGRGGEGPKFHRLG